MISMECFRAAIHALGEDGQEFGHDEVYTMLGLGPDDVDARRNIRHRCQNLTQQGELTRIRVGHYRVVPDALPRKKRDGYDRIWRTIATAQPGWTVRDIVVVSECGDNHVRHYLKWLLNEGYVTRHGWNQLGRTQCYRTTAKARERRSPAYPTPPARGAYPEERASLARLAKLFACADLQQRSVQNKIVLHCKTILARFERQEESDE